MIAYAQNLRTRSCIALALALVSTRALAQTDTTQGDCSPIVRAEAGASVVVDCARRAREQLAEVEREKQRSQRVVADTRAQLVALNQGVAHLSGSIEALRVQHPRSEEIGELTELLERAKTESAAKQAEFDQQRQHLTQAQHRATRLEGELGSYAARLKEIERDRVTPDALHWAGFGTALVGFSLAAGFGVASGSARRSLESELTRAIPTMNEPAAKATARRVRTGNTIANFSLAVGAVGFTVGAMYVKDLLFESTPLSLAAGHGEFTVHIESRFGSVR